MIGIAKTQMSSSVILSPYRVDLIPGAIFDFSDNGSSTSSTVFSTVISGIGPFTYLWVIDNTLITISTETSGNTSFQSSGYNQTNTGIATLTVTDTGNANLETSNNISVTFDFENIGL